MYKMHIFPCISMKLTLQTLYTAKACKDRITTQGFPCKKPVLPNKGLQCSKMKLLSFMN